MSLEEVLSAAEQILPGSPAPEGAEDPRWQAIIAISEYAQSQPEAIWPFVLKWGSHADEDLRAAIATCLLEDLLEFHFDILFPRVDAAARANALFGETVAMCWKFGQAKESGRSEQLDRLQSYLRKPIS
jgi:hypothetical protein